MKNFMKQLVRSLALRYGWVLHHHAVQLTFVYLVVLLAIKCLQTVADLLSKNGDLLINAVVTLATIHIVGQIFFSYDLPSALLSREPAETAPSRTDSDPVKTAPSPVAEELKPPEELKTIPIDTAIDRDCPEEDERRNSVG